MVISSWKITWDPAGTPVVFLDHGQAMDAEIDWPWSQEHEDRKVIEGTYTEPLPRSLVSGSVTFTAWKTHADDVTARAYILSHRAALPKGLRKPLRITPLAGSNVDLANTMLKTANGRMIVTVEGAMTAFTYTFLGPW